MRHMVAMQHPARGFARVECDIDLRHRRHIYSVPEGARDRASVQPDDLEHMSVQMHRVAHHRYVMKGQHDPLAAFRANRTVLAPNGAVDRPNIRLHCAAQRYDVATIYG